MASQRFLEIFLAKLKELIGSGPVTPSQEQVDTAFRAARAQAGGEAAGAARVQGQPAVAASVSLADAAMMAACPYCSGDQAGATEADCTCTADCGAADCPKAPVAAGAGTPAGAIRLAQMTSAAIDNLPDSAFAYIESGGTKDGEGKTTPRSKRHFPIHDAAHVRNALARAPQSPFGDKAMPAIMAAAKKMGIGQPAQMDAGSETEDFAPVYTALRLDDGAGLPEWQVFHVVGSHGNHPRYGPIDFTKEHGDQIIRNHAAGVLGRAVPLDFRHATQLDGEAGGYVDEFRWGRKGEGLQGGPAPSGNGPILYAHFPAYNDLGVQRLTQEHYRHQSPEYDRNYKGTHGAVALALAATNNPFLRGLRTLQGREQATPIMLDDASSEEIIMPNEPTPTVTTTPTTEPATATTQLSAGPGTTADPSGSISLEEARQLRDDLRVANAQLAATQELANDIRRGRHTDAVAARTAQAIERGTPPALVRIVGAVMLSCTPDQQGAVRLSDDPSASPVNVYAAMDQLLDVLPRVHMGRVTLAATEDQRPADDNEALTDQAYTEASKAKAAEINAQRGAVSQNGNGAH